MSIDQTILDKFEAVVESQLKRIADMKAQDDFIDYSGLDKLIIGVCGGDGIGPMITGMAQHALETLLADKVKAGKVEFRVIDGLTIERRAELGCAIPPDVMEQLKQCHVILKGPTTTPRKGDPWPNVESANVAMRKALDLFANVRPVKVPELGIDWTFYRENTEGGYAVGSQGVQIDDDLFIDFTVATSQGCERIARLAFDYARKTGKNHVSCVTKANIIKTTDGKFLDTCQRVAKEYPEVEFDDWYIDIMTAKLLDDKRRRDFKVVVLPNLYGDIITDEAAEIQAAWAPPARPTSASAMRCLRPSTAPRRAWCRRAARNTPTRPRCCAHRSCCSSTSARSSWRTSSTARLTSACLRRRRWSLPAAIPARRRRSSRITCSTRSRRFDRQAAPRQARAAVRRVIMRRRVPCGT